MNSVAHGEFRKWALTACADWGYPEPAEDYFLQTFARLPDGLMRVLGHGLETGLVIPQGRTFTLKKLDANKGPYNWFSRNPSHKRPSPNWEYFVQVAEYVRLFELSERNHLLLTFEDDLMDLALYQGKRLLVCCEVKERSDQLLQLLSGIREHEHEVDYTANDRGNDPLRKAKYIVNRRPEYFYLMSLGSKLEFSVSYPEGMAFRLSDDLIPFI